MEQVDEHLDYVVLVNSRHTMNVIAKCVKRPQHCSGLLALTLVATRNESAERIAVALETIFSECCIRPLMPPFKTASELTHVVTILICNVSSVNDVTQFLLLENFSAPMTCILQVVLKRKPDVLPKALEQLQ